MVIPAAEGRQGPWQDPDQNRYFPGGKPVLPFLLRGRSFGANQHLWLYTGNPQRVKPTNTPPEPLRRSIGTPHHTSCPTQALPPLHAPPSHNHPSPTRRRAPHSPILTARGGNSQQLPSISSSPARQEGPSPRQRSCELPTLRQGQRPS